jgi:hypothetical protein
MKEYIIYTKWVAYKLRKAGFRIIRVDVNPNKPQFDCYVFEDSDNFQKTLTAITSK